MERDAELLVDACTDVAVVGRAVTREEGRGTKGVESTGRNGQAEDEAEDRQRTEASTRLDVKDCSKGTDVHVCASCRVLQPLERLANVLRLLVWTGQVGGSAPAVAVAGDLVARVGEQPRPEAGNLESARACPNRHGPVELLEELVQPGKTAANAVLEAAFDDEVALVVDRVAMVGALLEELV